MKQMIEELDYSREFMADPNGSRLNRYRAVLSLELIPIVRKHPNYRHDVDGISNAVGHKITTIDQDSHREVRVYVSEKAGIGGFEPRVVAFVNAKDELEAFMYITKFIEEELMSYG